MNTFGNRFRLTTFGESHGPAVGGVIDGCPSQMELDMDFIQKQLSRRRGDGVEGTTPRKEADQIEWLSGIKDGITLGTPIAFMVRNSNTQSADYDRLKDLFRPGHGDYTWQQKYGIRDYRGGGRCSARETVSRVVAGSIALQILNSRGIRINTQAHTPRKASSNTSCGGTIECSITGCPVGLGEPVFDRLNSLLAYAMMSIPSATGFEIGEGFRAAEMTGAEYRDPFNSDFSTQTNHCGGIMGGLSNGMPIEFRVAFHPVISVGEDIPCVDMNGKEHLIKIEGRHDHNHVLRVQPIVESMAALTIINMIL